MTIPNNPLARKDIALTLIENVKVELENEDVNAAMATINQLEAHVKDWQRSENLQAARSWLENALRDDLLAFDTAIARDYLQKWADASDNPDENPELLHYRAKVDKRSQQKNTVLLERGVISHCDEILEEAQKLETGSEPPAPSFMLKNYYAKAHNIAVAVQADLPKNTELEQLAARVERILNNKESAALVYSMALENQKYSNALHNLDQLPSDALIPRFTLIEDTTGEKRLNYQGMVSIGSARAEITSLAKSWAGGVLAQVIKTSQQYVDAHEPQDAVEELEIGEHVEKFLEAEQKTELQTAQSEAAIQLRNRESAEASARKAIELAADHPLKAWDEYASAYQTYQWAEGLDEARHAAVEGIRSRLQAMAHEADVAFHEARDMEQVRAISQQAKSTYAGKDASVDELLAQFDEFEDMIRSYEEYITTGNEILAKVKELIWEDAVAANELLTQVESYPDFVLEAFAELYDLRSQVNIRLNADQTYNQLYTALFNDTLPEITHAIEHTNVAGSDFPSDDRFPKLELWLKYHMAFISAQQHFQRGANEQVLQLIAPVLNHPQHPDYENAQQMQQQIQPTQQETNVSNGTDEDNE